MIITDDKLSDEITWKRVVVLMTCVIKDECEKTHAFCAKWMQHKACKKELSKYLIQ